MSALVAGSLAWLAALLPVAQQAQPATPPAAAPAAPVPVVAPLPAGKQEVLQALVIGVEGRCEWKPAGANPWKVAAVNDLLDPGCEIRTGLRSTLALRVGKNATLLVDRSSRIELPLIVQEGAVLRTRAAVYRGKCDFKVEAIGITSDFQVLTPSATLAVRGTGFNVAWGGLTGLEVRGVDTNRIDAIELRWRASQQSVLLSGAAFATSQFQEPWVAALWNTVFPPPSPDRRLDDGIIDPARRPPPPPAELDAHHLQQTNEIGSEFAVNLQTGRGKPGIPPVVGK